MANFAVASFKTAYLQHEVVVKNKLTSDVKVGDVLYIDVNGKLSPRATTAAVAVGDYIVAQSDMTMEYGHIPVENVDYKYSDKVASSASDKKIAVFKIINLDDINLSLEARS